MTPQWKQLLDHLATVPEQVYEGHNSIDGWDNDTLFGRQFGENKVPWCVIFDWDMYADVGLAAIVPKVDNVVVFSDWARAHGQWSEYPSVGAWVNFANGHTEICVGFDADTVFTKGGNSVRAGSTDAGQGNGVWSHATARRSPRVVGYFAPHFPDGQCPPTADPHDPRGGRAQTSYTWPGPTTAPTPAPPVPAAPTEEDPMAGITAADIEAIVQQRLDANRDLIAHSVLYWLLQALSPTPADPGDHPLKWVVGPLGQAIRALPAGATPEQIQKAMAAAIAGGLQFNITPKGN